MFPSERFLETILLQDGVFPLLPFHQERFLRTWSTFFPSLPVPDLERELERIPRATGKFKVRIEYDAQNIQLYCMPFTRKAITTFGFAEDNSIVYDFKYADRKIIDKHVNPAIAGHHEIIFVKNGLVTDSTIANIVIKKNGRFLTPEFPLLAGVRRAQYLAIQRIMPAKLRVQDILNCEKIFFINALNSLEDDFSISPDQFLD